MTAAQREAMGRWKAGTDVHANAAKLADLAVSLFDESEITEEWLMSLPGVKRYQDTILIPFDNRDYESYIAVESDGSIAIQQKGYDDASGQYIPIPGKTRTRGQLSMLLEVLKGGGT